MAIRGTYTMETLGTVLIVLSVMIGTGVGTCAIPVATLHGWNACAIGILTSGSVVLLGGSALGGRLVFRALDVETNDWAAKKRVKELFMNNPV